MKVNTGGMGCYSYLNHKKEVRKKNYIKNIVPTLNALKRVGKAYGIFICWINDKKNNPYLIEYNIRMGDPECQVIIPRLKTDIIKIFEKATSNKLKNFKIEWKKQKSMTIVLCTKGYPEYKKSKNK